MGAAYYHAIHSQTLLTFIPLAYQVTSITEYLGTHWEKTALISFKNKSGNQCVLQSMYFTTGMYDFRKLLQNTSNWTLRYLAKSVLYTYCILKT